MARPRTAAQMTRLVAQWRASGEPQARFARRHGVRPWTLWYWSRKTAAPPAPPTFVPVQVTPAPERRAPIEVVLPDGIRVVAPADTSATHVAALVAALRAPC
jgi:transposase-like protein